MDALFCEPPWPQKLAKMLELHAPASAGPPRSPHASADREGAHALPLHGEAPHVTPTIWRSLFQNTVAR